MKPESKNILVFPCGSEIGLEIHRSLKYSTHFKLIGANSVDDHGKFVYKNYIPNVPFFTKPDFINHIKNLIKQFNIDAIYPTVDSVIVLLKENEEELNCKVISSNLDTVRLCLSKKNTYNKFEGKIRTPQIITSIETVNEYPIFLKPDVGYGSRNILKANNQEQAVSHLKKIDDLLILEYLPGKEYTVDCFTDFNGNLLFVGPRQRKRVLNGISVNTSTLPIVKEIEEMATIINDLIALDGAWFFQVKEDVYGKLCLLEIASRIAGSSSVQRIKGVNLPLLSLFNTFKNEIAINNNSYQVELDRAFSCKFNITIKFKYAYVDFDDTILVRNKLNIEIISCLYSFLNRDIKLILITKHTNNIEITLKKWRIYQLFDEIIHLQKDQEKYTVIKETDAIFIDDSHQERINIKKHLNIPVFSPDMVEALI